MLRKLFAHSFLYSIAPQLPKIVTLALMPVITKNVTAFDYAVYGIITSYLFFANALKDLGFGVVFVNSFYKNPTRWKFLWRIFWGHLTIWSIFFLLITATLLYVAIPASEIRYYWQLLLLVGVPVLVFDNVNLISNYYFRFSERALFIAVSSASAGIITIITTYYCIVHLHLGYRSWFIATFVAAFVLFVFNSIAAIYRLRLLPIIVWRQKFIRPYLKVALPMIPHNYSTYLLNSSDRIVLDQYKVDLRKVGVYNIAYTFGNYFESIGEAVGMAATPFFSKLYAKPTKKSLVDARNLAFFLMIAFLTAAFLVSLWLKEAFQILIKNSELQQSYGIGIIIIMGYTYRPMYWSAGMNLSLSEKTSALWKISFVAGMLNVIANVIFVPFYGIYAAAISTFGSLLYMGFAGFFLKSYRSLPQVDHYPLLWIALISTLSLAAYLLKDAQPVTKLLITAAILSVNAVLLWKNFHRIQQIKV